MTRFPMALVPTFLVPLAFVLHFVSLWQLLGRPSPLGTLSDQHKQVAAPLDAPRVESGAADRRQEDATHPVLRSDQCCA
jgi:hypothetical protein